MSEADWDLLLALSAFDTGSTDSGIRDDGAKARLGAALRALPDAVFRVELGRRLREWFLSDEALEAGYGAEDVVEFCEWLRDEMDCAV
jgi:hypothetical protein